MEKLKLPPRWRRLGEFCVVMILSSQATFGALDWEARLGYFVPSNDRFFTIYGPGLTYGGEVALWSADGWGIGLGTQHFTKTAEFLTGEQIAEISITSIDATLMWVNDAISRAAVGERIYLGMGGSIQMVNEETVAGFERFHLGISENQTLGFHVLSGINIRISANIALTLETKYSLAEVETEGRFGRTKVNLGGYTIFLGLRF